MEAGQTYLGWMVLVAGWLSCGADPSTGDSAGPGGTEGPGGEQPPLGGEALEPGGRGGDSHLGQGTAGKTGPRGPALTFPVGSPSVWLSSRRLEPFGDAGCSW